MHSIVATIQAEQDKAIRAPNKGVVSISGGPGTGKTVVALHRAAYLLYGDRRRYESGGVLVVGPSGVFMRYIERVLPSLGETAVALRSLGEVVDGVRATRRDEPAVAEIKGSAAMAELLRRTARQAVPDAPREFRVFYRDDVITLDARELGSLRRQLLSGSRRNQSTTTRRLDPDRRDVAPGPQRTRPRSHQGGLLGRAPDRRPVPRVRRRLVAGARRGDRARLAARPRPARTRGRGRARRRGGARSCRSRGETRSRSTTSRCSTSCATCSVTRRS